MARVSETEEILKRLEALEIKYALLEKRIGSSKKEKNPPIPKPVSEPPKFLSFDGDYIDFTLKSGVDCPF